MLKYLIQFVIYIDENKRPRDIDYQRQFFVNHMMQFENEQQMAEQVNNLYKAYTQDPGVTVFKDGGYSSGIPGADNIARRQFIPWHMITHMEANITLMTDVADTKPRIIEPELVINQPKELPN